MLPIVFSGIAPGIALLTYFYLRHEHESEPVGYILRSFIFGILLVFPLMFIEYIIQSEFGGLESIQLVRSAVTEEFAKWFVVFYTVYIHQRFNDYYDGIIYAVACSLGFATLENILYLMVNGTVEHMIFRALLPVSGHALFAVIMGFFMGKAKFSNHPYRWLGLSIFVPMVVHAIFNLLILENGGISIVPILFMVGLWMVGLYQIRSANRLNQRHNRKSN
ncbi:glutamic-type intramembrane protease PrsW [Exiguobacterium sibiricum]|uniref:glutamic-type intramembrane protease PrsW n=1 Tax=Exiguobacterium TaxID=33986 RepID=UPI00047C1DB6|nr:glutamic-type intramembrane protease PrsW [Exiguobacterium sibiricum]MCK2156971.1 glutamic-type intramembrane protease PrsW [Exiguobacterium sp. 17-1]